MKSKSSSQMTVKRIQHLYYEIAKLITSSLEINKIINAVMEEVNIFFEPRNWSLFRLDPITQELYFVVSKGLDENTIKNVRLKLGEGIAGQVALTGQPMLVKDTKNHPQFSQKIDKLSRFDTRSLIAVPIKFQDQILGVIEIVNALHDRPFTKHELSVLITIAEFSAIALTNAMAYERMSLLAIKDSLTGLYNRAYLNKLILACNNPEELGEVHKPYVVVAVIDINHFKQVNDKYGHHAGDEILCKVAEQLQSCCRPYNSDFVFRIGGDEFLIVIKDLDQKDVSSAEKYLLDYFKNNSKKLSLASGYSFGVVTGLKTDLESLIDQADKLMYKIRYASRA